MALLNGMYLFVITETPVSEIETVAHPVETGINITDHVRKKPDEITLEGEIVGENARDVLEQLKQINQKGAVVTYSGVNYFKNGQIMDLETEHTNEIDGGCSFTMTIREVRFAQNSYDPNSGTAKPGSAAAEAAATNRATKETTSAGVQQRERYSGTDLISHVMKIGETALTVSNQYPDAKLASVAGQLAEEKAGQKVTVEKRRKAVQR